MFPQNKPKIRACVPPKSVLPLPTPTAATTTTAAAAAAITTTTHPPPPSTTLHHPPPPSTTCSHNNNTLLQSRLRLEDAPCLATVFGDLSKCSDEPWFSHKNHAPQCQCVASASRSAKLYIYVYIGCELVHLSLPPRPLLLFADLVKFWEPFLLVRRFERPGNKRLKGVPRYEEMYIGRYRNKVSFVTRLRAERYKFYSVLREFSVHSEPPLPPPHTHTHTAPHSAWGRTKKEK